MVGQTFSLLLLLLLLLLQTNQVLADCSPCSLWLAAGPYSCHRRRIRSTGSSSRTSPRRLSSVKALVRNQAPCMARRPSRGCGPACSPGKCPPRRSADRNCCSSTGSLLRYCLKDRIKMVYNRYYNIQKCSLNSFFHFFLEI